MKENYELGTPPRKNPYAEQMKKNGYSVAIHYDTPEDIDADSSLETIRSLLKQPGLNAIHLYIRHNNHDAEERADDAAAVKTV